MSVLGMEAPRLPDGNEQDRAHSDALKCGAETMAFLYTKLACLRERTPARGCPRT